MGLEGLETFLEQQEHEHGEGQHAIACEVGGAAAMARAKVRGDEPLAELFDEAEGTVLETQSVLPPHGESRM